MDGPVTWQSSSRFPVPLLLTGHDFNIAAGSHCPEPQGDQGPNLLRQKRSACCHRIKGDGGRFRSRTRPFGCGSRWTMRELVLRSFMVGLTPLAPALGSKLIPRVGALMLYRHSRTFEEVRRRRSLCPQASASYRVLGRWLPDRRRRRSEATPHRGVVVSTRDAKIGGVGVDPARSVANLPPSGTWRGRERTIRCQSFQSSHP